MSKALRTVGMVVGAVALIAATAGLAAPAVAATATTAASAGGVLGVSAATLAAIGTYGGLAAGVLSMAAGALAPGFSAEGSATTFTTNPQSGLPYAIGRTRMSGLRAYARTYDGFKQQSKDDILAFVVMLSIAGPIHSVEKFTADNEVVTFAAGEDGDANGRFYRYMAQRLSLGAVSGPALNMTYGGKPYPDWGPSHKLSGIAHAQWALRFDTDGDLYGAGAPEPAWTGKWVKVYDPRKDSTYPGGSGSHRALNEATYEWSDNPGLHALTWALGRWQNGKRVCGIGAPVANIRVAEFVECANVCDANNWKVGGVEWTTDSKWDTMKRMLQAGGAIPTQTGAMIGCLTSTPRTAIATIESRHLHDGLSFASTKSRRDRFNTVIPRYVDEDSDWAVISGTAVTESAYVTADGGQRTKEIDFPLVQVFSGETAEQPGQLAAYAIVNSREGGPFTWTTGPEWIGLKTGDVVYLNVPEEGLVNQPVLITRRAPDPATGKVSFSGETETYSKHAYALGQSTTPPAPFSLTAPDLKPAAPLSANWGISGATSGEGFPALLVTGASEMPSADAVVIDYRLTGTEEWTSSAILSAVGPVSHVIAPLKSTTAYDVRIGYRVGTSVGNFTLFANVTTGLGKVTIIEGALGAVEEQIEDVLLEVNQKIDIDIEPPAIPTGLALTSTISLDTDKRQIVTLKADWSAVVVSDLAGYVLSVREGSGSWIEFKIGGTATHWEMRVPANTSFSARILAYDVQGNRSLFSSTVAHTTAKDTTPPAVPTALSATASFSAIYLSLTAPADADVSAIEIWENTSSSTSGRTLVATVNALPGQAAGFTRSGLGTGVTRWSWTRAIDTSGNPSGFTASVSATTASINYTDFVGGLEPPSSGPSLPNPVGYSGPKLFFNTTNKKLYRYDASGPVWTTATDGADIVAATITGDKVQFGQLVGAHMAVGAITARALMIADLSNLVVNNISGGDLDGWTWSGTADAYLSGSAQSASAGVTGYMARSLDGDSWLRSPQATAKTGDQFYVEAMVWRDSGTDGSTLLQVRWDIDNGDGTTSAAYDTVAASTTASAWEKKSGVVTAPANARTVSIWFRPRYGGSAGRVLLARPVLRRAASGELIVDGAVVARHVAVGSLTGDRITAGTIGGDRFITNTSLPGTITVGSTGVSIGTIQAQADDPAVRVNAKSTLINPGKILLAGSTTLSSLLYGGDNTLIDGGKLATNTVTANKLEIGARGISIEGLQFSYNKANNQLSWTVGVIRYTRDNGTSSGDPDGYVNVNAGSATWASGTLFVYWNKGAADPANGATVSLSSSTSAATANGTNTLVLATYKGGTNFIANYGQTIIDGATIRTRSVTSDILDVNSVRASNIVVADLSNLVINNFTGGDADGWTWSGPFELYQSSSAITLAAGVAGWMMQVYDTTGWLRSPHSTCATDEKFYFEVMIYRSNSPSTSTLVQARWDVDDGTGALTANYSTVGSASAVGSWTKVTGIVTAPANAKTVSLWIRPTTSGGIGRILIARPIIRRASSAELIVNGSITADKLSVNSLDAISAVIGTLRSATTGARFELRTTGLRLYDSGNTLRVSLEV